MAKKKGKSKSITTSFVLDCSVSIAWFFEDELDSYAESIENSLLTATAIVPALWMLEVGNALIVGERRKRTTKSKVESYLKLIESLPIVIDDQTRTSAWRDAINIARTHDLSVYDAAYVELALRKDAPLATLDKKLVKAAKAAGVDIYVPGSSRKPT